MQSGAFWYTISRNVRVCAMNSSRLDDFSNINRNDNNTFFFGGGGNLAFWGGEFYPSNTLDRTLQVENGVDIPNW